MRTRTYINEASFLHCKQKLQRTYQSKSRRSYYIRLIITHRLGSRNFFSALDFASSSPLLSALFSVSLVRRPFSAHRRAAPAAESRHEIRACTFCALRGEKIIKTLMKMRIEREEGRGQRTKETSAATKAPAIAAEMTTRPNSVHIHISLIPPRTGTASIPHLLRRLFHSGATGGHSSASAVQSSRKTARNGPRKRSKAICAEQKEQNGRNGSDRARRTREQNRHKNSAIKCIYLCRSFNISAEQRIIIIRPIVIGPGRSSSFSDQLRFAQRGGCHCARPKRTQINNFAELRSIRLSSYGKAANSAFHHRELLPLWMAGATLAPRPPGIAQSRTNQLICI